MKHIQINPFDNYIRAVLHSPNQINLMLRLILGYELNLNLTFGGYQNLKSSFSLTGTK